MSSLFHLTSRLFQVLMLFLVCGGLTWESLVSLLQIKAETEHSRKVGAGTCLLVHMYLKDSMAVGLPEVLLYPRGRLCDHTQS